jgi:hypothetical protein
MGGGGFTVRARIISKKEKRMTERMRWRKDIKIKSILERVMKNDEDIKIRRRQPEAKYNEEEENHENK